MKREFSRSYQARLLAYLKLPPGADPKSAQGIGQSALNAGLEPLELAKLHEQILVTRVLPGRSPSQCNTLMKQAGAFFTEAITPLEETDYSAREASAHLNNIVRMLSRRTVELAATNLALNREIILRNAAEESLKKSERHYSELLEKSDRLQELLRRLSRQILSAQEEERKEISRELHDVIAQTLTGINVRLATLKKEAAINTKNLGRNITSTQRLVEKSVKIVHQFARELRPAVLDDLGLVPALHSYMKSFTARTGVRSKLTAFAGVEKVEADRRTVLFRVAQEALTNVARHAKASRADVAIQRLQDTARMEIKDDGKSFDVEQTLHGKGNRRLGLLGMRERVEMVGGTFCVESAPGQGTTVRVEMPFGRDGNSPVKKSGKKRQSTLK